jgi:hypothetical protein
MASSRRILTTGESHILDLLRDYYGPANNADAVFFTDRDEAVIFVTDCNGIAGMAVNLTNVALFQQMDNLSDEETIEQWLRIPES